MKKTQFTTRVRSQRRITLPAGFEPGEVVSVEVSKEPDIRREGSTRIIRVFPHDRVSA